MSGTDSQKRRMSVGCILIVVFGFLGLPLLGVLFLALAFQNRDPDSSTPTTPTTTKENAEPERTRGSEKNRLRGFGLAFHSLLDHSKFVMGPYCVPPESRKPNKELSLRVQLLPFLDEEPLYRKFHLEEPWNSPHNRPASDQRLEVYSAERDAKTPFRFFQGGGALFSEEGGRFRLEEIRDGSSHTILTASFAEKVPWAAPREWKYGPNAPLPEFGTKQSQNFPALFCDGHVVFIKKEIDPAVLRALITKKGEELLPPESEWSDAGSR